MGGDSTLLRHDTIRLRLITPIAVMSGRTRLLFLFVAFIADPLLAQQEAPPAPVVVLEAKQQVLAPITWFPGSVISRNDSKLAAEESGRLVEVAEVGARVSAGDVLASIDNSLLRQELIETETEVTRELARLEYYDREVTRLEKLATGNNVAQNQLDEAISNRSVTRSELAAARARVALTQERLRRFVVRAPFSGVVTERLMQTGEWAEIGKSVVRLVDADSVEVQVWVPVSSLEFVELGSELKLESNPRSTIGVVRIIVPVGDDRSRLYELRVSISEPRWPAGQTLRVAVPTAKPQSVIAIHRDALVLRRSGVTVYRIGADNTAEAVAVTTGIAAGELIEVSGIELGDQVVTRGGERLRPGQTVQITNSPAPE